MDDDLLLKTRRALAEALACIDELRASQATSMEDAYARRAFPFDCPLVRVADLVNRFGGSKEAAAAFLRTQGAKQLPRTTQGGGVPAITLWALRDHERLMAKSARARVGIYLNHHNLAEPGFDPLEL